MNSESFLWDLREIPSYFYAKLHQEAFPDAPWSIQSFEELFALKTVSGKALWNPLAKTCWGFYVAQQTIDCYELLTLVIQKSQKKKGWGSFLFQTFIEDVRHKGAREIFLEVAINNKEAISLYTKNGFKQIGIRQKYYKQIGNCGVDALTFLLQF